MPTVAGRSPPVQFLGRISLQIYLLHVEVLRVAMIRLELYEVAILD